MRTKPIKPRLLSNAFLLTASLAGACTELEGEPDLATDEQPIAGDLGTFEFAIDAPWRIEPTVSLTGAKSYGAIPINISILDAHMTGELQTVRFDKIKRIEVFEESSPNAGVQTFAINQLHEIEYTNGKWVFTSAQPGTVAPPYTLCRLWKGDLCPGLDILEGRSEWHGTVMYNLRDAQILPGEDIALRVTAVVSQKPVWCVPADDGDPFTPPPQAQWCPQPDRPLTNYLKVHLGEEVMPRFDARWTYGDLHYHSQGTDNEGESGYAHRNVIRAMAAMGMDWALATEHASNSAQLVDVAVDILGGIFTDDPIIELKSDELRDMSQMRYQKLLERLNNTGGANRELTFPRVTGTAFRNPRYAVPQLFLGGEVDTIPEMTGLDRTRGWFPFGNSRSFVWDTCDQHLLEAIEDESTIVDWLVDVKACPNGRDDLIASARTNGLTGTVVPDRFFIKDVQGPLQLFFGRNHLLHFPASATASSSFIPSSTSVWGGATRRFKQILDDEYTMQNKGLTFLAHPLSYEEGLGPDRYGPDIVPYSPAQLDDAFRNRHVVGLQLWNSDNRLATTPGAGDSWMNAITLQPWFKKQSSPPLNYEWQEAPTSLDVYTKLHHGTFTWDRMLRWGIDSKKLVGLGLNGLPRRIFMGGGSDAHGDLNYRREGGFTGTSKVVDTAIGKPRNLLFVGTPAGTPLDKPATATGTAVPFSQLQISNALRSGNFTVTDGPALRVVIDKNNDGLIDDGDVPMGGVGTYTTTGDLPILVEWKSTPEFRAVQYIDLYVGVHSDVLDLGFTYAPEHHGVRNPTDPQGIAGLPWRRPNGTFQRVLHDGYHLDPTGQLRINVPSGQGYGGVARVVLAPRNFPVGRLRMTPRAGCTPVTPCVPNPHAPGSCEPAPDDPPPQYDNCMDYFFDTPTTPDRLYVRAFAKTAGSKIVVNGQTQCVWKNDTCLDRFAFTNPVWAQVSTYSLPPNPN